MKMVVKAEQDFIPHVIPSSPELVTQVVINRKPIIQFTVFKLTGYFYRSVFGCDRVFMHNPQTCVIEPPIWKDFFKCHKNLTFFRLFGRMILPLPITWLEDHLPFRPRLSKTGAWSTLAWENVWQLILRLSTCAIYDIPYEASTSAFSKGSLGLFLKRSRRLLCWGIRSYVDGGFRFGYGLV